MYFEFGVDSFETVWIGKHIKSMKNWILKNQTVLKLFREKTLYSL